MHAREEALSLENIAEGAIVEKFDRALVKILHNLMDPNTTAAKREIVIKVGFKRNDDRSIVEVTASCTTKPAPDLPIAVAAFIGKDVHGKVHANEILPAQQPLFKDNVQPIRKVEEE